jgi:glycosyltransferase involved in cell wall biosynthesis
MSTDRRKGARSIALFTCFEWVSISTSVINTARYLADRGYEVDLYLIPGGRFGEPVFAEPTIRKIVVIPRRFLIGQLKFLWARWRKGKDYQFAIGFDPLGLVTAAMQRLVFGTPYVYHSLEILCVTRESHWKLRLLKKLERWAARRALLCLTQDAQRGAILANDLGIAQGRIGIALNSPIGPALPQRSEYLQRKLGIDASKTIVLAAGSLMREHWIDRILDSVDAWPADCVLVLHGWIPDSDFATQVMAESAKRPGRVFVSTDLLPDAEKYQVFQSAAIGLVCYEPTDDNLKYAAGSSGKLYDFMRVGVPVVANDIPGMRELVEGNSCGIVVQSAALIGQAISTLLAHYRTYSQSALAAYENCRFEASYEVALARIESSLPQGRGR